MKATSGAMKTYLYLLGGILFPASFLGLVWFSYWSSDKGLSIPAFLIPNSTEQDIISWIFLLAGAISFNGWLITILRSLKFKAWSFVWRFVIWLIATSVYLTMMLATVLICGLLIACSFGDCL
jgi:hypothetical protein